MSQKYFASPAFMNSPHPSQVPLPIFKEEHQIFTKDTIVPEDKKLKENTTPKVKQLKDILGIK